MTSRTFNCGSSLRFSILFLSQLVFLSLGRAQVVMDTSFGRNGGAVPKLLNNYDITAALGKTVGNNLFHSFSQFDLVSGDFATFSGPVNIQNILTRITGANTSSIDGTIRSTIDGANLFFLNPHGVVFGQNAHLDVKGSFVVTSAHYIGLSDGRRFDTVNPSANDPLLSSAPPSAFGFLGPTVASISFNGCSLAVPNQKSLSVIGGDVQIVNGQLTAAGGRINIVSLGSAGTVTLDVNDLNAALDTSSFTTLGSFTMNNSTLFGDDFGLVGGGSVGGGKVAVQAQELTFDGSGIEASSLGSENSLGVDVTVRDQMTLQNKSFIFSDAYSTGNGGNMNIQTHQLQVLSASAITCDSLGTGNGGNINVSADSIVLDGQTDPNSFAGIGARANSGGNAGDVALTTQTLDIRNGMILSTVSAGAGDAGNATVSASAIHIDGHGVTSGIIADTTTGGGDAGDVAITTATLEISNAGRISSATSGAGHGGHVTVTATDSILMDGEEGALFTGIGVPPLVGAIGPGGNLVINTPLLTILNGARILVGTLGSGLGGNVDVTATDILLDGGDATRPTGIQAQTDGTGKGGSITVNTDSLRMINGSQINADTGSTGAGGAIDITAHSIDIESSSQLSATSDGQGPGGRITIAADSLLVNAVRTDGSVGFAGIFAGNPFGVQGNASAGDIVIGPGASGNLSVQLLNGAEISASTQGASDGGSIVIDATTLTLDNHASIQCATVGSGQAGNISLNVQDTLQLTGSSSIAVPAASQNGGNITVTAGNAITMSDSSFTASAGDNGGNIQIGTKSLVLSGGSIEADVVGVQGGTRAGNITIGPGASGGLSLQLFNGARISASTQGGSDGGNVSIEATDVSLDGHSSIECSTVGSGDAGNISLTVQDTLQLTGSSSIAVPAASQNGGNITVTAGNAITMSDSSFTASAGDNGGNIQIGTKSLALSGGSIEADVTGVQGGAKAGNITIGPGASGGLTLQLSNGARISASTQGGSDGGDVTVNATDVSLDGHASIQCSTVGSGDAGNISLTVQDTLQLTDSSSIAVPAASQNGGNIVINVGSLVDLQDSTLDASAGKNGGNITLNAGSQVSLLNSTLDASASDNGGNITLSAGSQASLHTSSLDATAGKNGGNITLTVGSLIYLLDSTITASAGDNGGNITIDPDFLVLDHSPITADAINNNGGNINILSEYFLSSDSPITADSQFGNPGTILIQAVELDLTASLASLTSSLLGAESQLRERCGVRAAGGISSFLVLGRGGAPFEPNGPLPTFGLGPAGDQAN